MAARICRASSALAMALTAAACGGDSSSTAPTSATPAPQVNAAPVTVGPGLAVSAMLRRLEAEIASAIQANQALIPANRHLEALLRARIATLQDPALPDRIRNEQWHASGTVSSRMGGKVISLGTVFIAADMRPDAMGDLDRLREAVPIVEEFYAQAWPCDSISEWYGFKLGNTGGGCSLWMEDQATYEGRTPASRLPHEAILIHESAHTYIGHESLNQFVELYVFNLIHTGSKDVAAWIFTRDYRPFARGNTGVSALMDVYQLIGPEAMARAYRTAQRLRPPYGQVLSDACKQAFVDEAPDTLKGQVSTIVQRITY